MFVDDDNAVTLIAGSRSGGYVDGMGSVARFSSPFGLLLDVMNDRLIVADSHRIRLIGLPVSKSVETKSSTSPIIVSPHHRNYRNNTRYSSMEV